MLLRPQQTVNTIQTCVNLQECMLGHLIPLLLQTISKDLGRSTVQINNFTVQTDGNFPFWERQSQLIYYREMSNWEKSTFIRYSSPALAFSNWCVTPEPESIEVNVKTPPEFGSSNSKFSDLAER